MKFDQMYRWLKWQYLYVFFSLFISFIVFCIYYNMNLKAEEKIVKKKGNSEKIESDKK